MSQAGPQQKPRATESASAPSRGAAGEARPSGISSPNSVEPMVSQQMLQRQLGEQAYPKLTIAQRLDNRIWVDTPEQIRFRYSTVGPLRRFTAFGLDVVLMFAGLGLFIFIIWALFGLVNYLFPLSMEFRDLLQGMTFFATVVAIFGAYWLSSAGQEYFFNGLTLGKRSAGIRVVSLDGRPPSLMQCFGRNFLRLADGLPAFPLIFLFPDDSPIESIPQTLIMPTFLAGLVAMLMTQRFQRIGDLFAGTMVVEDEKYTIAEVPVFRDQELLSLALKIPMEFHPTREMLETLSLYVGRRVGFHHQRRLQMAGHLARPLIARWQLPADTNYDLLMGALYLRSVCEYQQVESMYADVEQETRNRNFLGAAISPGSPGDVSTAAETTT